MPHEFECPFCGNAGQKLLLVGLDTPATRNGQVVGAGQRLGACETCGAWDRERLVYLFLRDHSDLFIDASHKSILHVAPEPQLRAKLARANFAGYVCGDLLAPGYDYDATTLQLDIQAICFPAYSFDFVICNHVLEHVYDDNKAMRELYRVLKCNGQAILQVPIAWKSETTIEDLSTLPPLEREARFGQRDHYRLYGSDYSSRLASAGFSVQAVSIQQYHRSCGLHPREYIWHCVRE